MRILDGGNLYGHITSELVESMDSANMSSRVHNMNIFNNSIIELTRLENKRYLNFQKIAFERTHVLSEYARKKNIQSYKIDLMSFTSRKQVQIFWQKTLE